MGKGGGTLFCQVFLGGPFVKVNILFIRELLESIHRHNSANMFSVEIDCSYSQMNLCNQQFFSHNHIPKVHFCFQKLVLWNKNFINAYILKCNYANLEKMPGKTV